MDFPAAGYVGRWLPGNMGTDEEKNHGPSFNLDMLKDPVPCRERLNMINVNPGLMSTMVY